MSHCKCEYCGQFISHSDFEREEADGCMVYTSYPEPEPSHEVFWHRKCKDKHYANINEAAAVSK